jgi:glucose-fructose oxidoreductase
VSTPNHLHAEQAVAALEAGKHVLLQKPMAPTVAGCRRIVDAGRRAGRVVGLFMSSLGDPVNHELRAMVAAGAFGKLVSLRGRMAHRNAHVTWKRWNYGPDYWRRKKELVGGGGMALIGIHAINLVPWLAGSPIESLSAFSENVASREVLEGDDITAAVCRLSCGALAVLEASYASESGALELCGSAGYALLRGGDLRVRLDAPWHGRVLELPGGEKELVLGAEELGRRRAPFAQECEQHGAFARAVLAGEPPPVTGADGLRDVAVLEAIYRSAQTGRREQPLIPGELGP